MTCGGCSGAVLRVLNKMDGDAPGNSQRSKLILQTGLQVKKVEWETKEVIAESSTGEPSFEDVLAKIQKTGVRGRLPVSGSSQY